MEDMRVAQRQLERAIDSLIDADDNIKLVAAAVRALAKRADAAEIVNTPGQHYESTILDRICYFAYLKDTPGCADVLRLLLQIPGVDANARSCGLQTPLMHTLFVPQRSSAFECMQLLLREPDIDVNAQDDSDATALYYATRAKHAAATLAILSHPACDGHWLRFPSDSDPNRAGDVLQLIIQWLRDGKLRNFHLFRDRAAAEALKTTVAQSRTIDKFSIYKGSWDGYKEALLQNDSVLTVGGDGTAPPAWATLMALRNFAAHQAKKKGCVSFAPGCPAPWG